MNSENLVAKYRRFLLIVAAFIFVGSAAELVFIEHYEETVQFIPFGLSALGLVTVLLALRNPTGATLKWMRYSMAVIALGTLFGVYEHLEHNYEFALEISPNITTMQALVEALYGGSPFLAPGVFFLAAVLAYAATWQHPKLSTQ